MSFIGRFFHYLQNRWTSEGGYREFLVMAVPLIISTSAWSIQHFVDRMFLTWYSPAAIAAAMPAGMLNFTIVSIFMGTVSYTSTFIAQYYGAERYDRVGPVLWQGVYISFVGALVLAAAIPFAGPAFRLIGHAPAVMADEITYFGILCMGGFPILASAALSGFFSGTGRTWTITWVNMAGTAANLVLDYLFIFGVGPFPELGIAGAAAATVFSGIVTLFIYLFILSRRKYDDLYHTRRGWSPDWTLLRRVLRYGFPSGVQFFLDIAAFTAFIMILGTLGMAELAASNIAFNISTIAFMPMIGSGIAASVLVGQYLGKNNPATAEKSVYSGFHIAFTYMFFISALYVLVPGLFVAPFSAAAGGDPAQFERIRGLVIVLLRFVAAYSLFDAVNLIFASALKGAGDTHYVMRMIVLVSLGALVVPSYLALIVFDGGIYTGWLIASGYVALLALSFLWRFVKGPWKSMRVIEPQAPFIPGTAPEAFTEDGF